MHFKTWTNSESHLQTSLKKSKMLSFFPKLLGGKTTSTKTGKLKPGAFYWTEHSCQSYSVWLKMKGTPYTGSSARLQLAALTACLAIRFRALYQDQSVGNTCGSTGKTSASKSAGNQDYSQWTIGKKQTCSPASKANFSHHTHCILHRPACMESSIF